MHSELSHDSRGKLPEIIAAAKATRTKIVGFTEHPSKTEDVVAANVKGWRDDVYFLAGTESNNELYWPGREGQPDLRFVAHPEEVAEFDRQRYDGMEIYNTHSDALDEPLKTLFGAMILNLVAVRDHPEAAFASFLDYPAGFLARFDRLTREGPFAGIAANDSHQNVSVELIASPDGSVRALDGGGEEIWRGEGAAATLLRLAFGHRGSPTSAPASLAKMQIDPYEISMRHVGTYLQIQEITEKSVRQAMCTGRAVLAFEILAPLPAIGFWIEHAGRPHGPVGDRVRWRADLTLRCRLPLDADIRIVRDGETFYEGHGDQHAAAKLPGGVYRLEAFVNLAGQRWPWVITNPIYVRDDSAQGDRR
jgi:hypothetical protein